MKTFLGLLLGSFVISTHATTLHYDESIDGDLGYYSFGSKEILQLGVGTNTIKGTIDSFVDFENYDFETETADAFDDFIFTIDPGHILTAFTLSINVLTGTNPDDGTNFLSSYFFNKEKIGYHANYENKLERHFESDIRYGDFHFLGGQNASINIFDMLSINSPLESGIYETEANIVVNNLIFDYEYHLEVSAIPVPASIWLFVSGLFSIATLVRRRKN